MTATTNVDLVGVFAPTTLEQGNRNLLFLGANNTLFWNNTTNDIYGFRAYFEIKEGAARHAVRARIVQAEQTPTDLRTIQDGQEQNAKAIENGQLIIRRNGEVYNALGERYGYCIAIHVHYALRQRQSTKQH